MGFHGECGRGWSTLCAASKGKKCRCKCGGANHGKLAQTFVIDATTDEQKEILAFARRHANYSIVRSNEQEIVIRDEGPWDRFPTVTNDAEWVVAQFADSLRGRRLMYYDSEQSLDELLVRDGEFAGFAPGPQVSMAASVG